MNCPECNSDKIEFMPLDVRMCHKCLHRWNREVGEWDFEGEVAPDDAPDETIWRNGVERYLRINGKWVMSGSYEMLTKYENLSKGNI